MKKQHQKKVENSVIIPPNEQRCVVHDGKKWRCKNRIADTGIRYCEKHDRAKNKYKLVRSETAPMEKYTNGKEGNSSSECNGGSEKSEFDWKEKRKRTLTKEIQIHHTCVERRVSNRLKQKKENKRILDDDLTVNESTKTIQQITNHAYRIEDGPPGFLTKSLKAEATVANFETHSRRCYEELKSSGESTNREVELVKLLGHFESERLRLSVELQRKRNECVEIQGKLVDLERRKIAAVDELNQLKRRQERDADSRIARLQQDQKVLGQRQEGILGRITHFGEEQKKMDTELKHGKRRAEDEIQVWKKKFCDLETRLLSIEKICSRKCYSWCGTISKIPALAFHCGYID
ncbi:uncharacterized protein LOC113326139 isoform X2 [Papaver somniferum]|uniref:uncharacterized protein LOC113326139 isoform X2 n=1 Tax=Papaver somniferum TaxID=3469 RepID=UPI000E70020F|nr:uncharacterized protein LOC113326139 isoform X2 [Papaver somniferum]